MKGNRHICGSAALLLLVCAASQATVIDSETWKSLSPEQQAAHLRFTTLHHLPPFNIPGKLDNTPPVLKSYTLTAPADVAKPYAQVVLNATSTDDLSGVDYYFVALKGPQGQIIYVDSGNVPIPAKSLTQTSARPVTQYLVPGTYTLFIAEITDAAGNTQQYDAAQLAALGNPSITIVNSETKYLDFTPPVLVSGKVITPKVSASSFAKGTNEPPFVGADFALADAGSGPGQTQGYWCLLDYSSCFATWAAFDVVGVNKATLHTIDQLSGAPPGEYFLQQVELWDQAGNQNTYFGADFGGSTDFSKYMPKGHTITVTP